MKISIILRWLTFIPAGIAAYLLVWVLYPFLFDLLSFGYVEKGSWEEWVFHFGATNYFAGAVLPFIIYVILPDKKLIISIICSVLILAAFSYLAIENEIKGFDILALLISTAGIITVLIYLYKERPFLE